MHYEKHNNQIIYQFGFDINSSNQEFNLIIYRYECNVYPSLDDLRLKLFHAQGALSSIIEILLTNLHRKHVK